MALRMATRIFAALLCALLFLEVVPLIRGTNRRGSSRWVTGITGVDVGTNKRAREDEQQHRNDGSIAAAAAVIAVGSASAKKAAALPVAQPDSDPSSDAAVVNRMVDVDYPDSPENSDYPEYPEYGDYNEYGGYPDFGDYDDGLGDDYVSWSLQGRPGGRDGFAAMRKRKIKFRILTAATLVTSAHPNIAMANRRRLDMGLLGHAATYRDHDYIISPELFDAAYYLSNKTPHRPVDAGYKDRAALLKTQYWGLANSTNTTDTTAPFWMPSMTMDGVAPEATAPSYTIWRNVRHYGAVGDGITDDTAAINDAIRAGSRCSLPNRYQADAPPCSASDTTPAVIYFPPGTYLISGSLDVYYNTQLLGDPTDRPTIVASRWFLGYAAIRTDVDERHLPPGHAMRSVRNFVVDMTFAPPGHSVLGIHWQAAQASDLHNIDIYMRNNTDPAAAAANDQMGLYVANGRGGLLSDIYIQGGRLGLHLGHDHFAARNVLVVDSQVGVLVPGRRRDGADLLHGLVVVATTLTHGHGHGSVPNGGGPVGTMGVALDCITGRYRGPGSLLLADSTFVGMATAVNQIQLFKPGVDDEDEASAAAILIHGDKDGVVVVPTWRMRVGKTKLVGKMEATARPASLVVRSGVSEADESGAGESEAGESEAGDETEESEAGDETEDRNESKESKGIKLSDEKETGGSQKWLSGWFPTGKKETTEETDSPRRWFTRRAPTYADSPHDIVNIKSLGVHGDGRTDDTIALNEALATAAAANQVLFVPYGVYIVTDTVHIPAGTRIVGQVWPTIEGRGSLFRGSRFQDRPVVQIGQPGDKGVVEISDMAFSLVGEATTPAVVQWNIRESDETQGSAAMWNTHIRCPAGSVPLLLTATSSAYLENVGVSTVGAAPMNIHSLSEQEDADKQDSGNKNSNKAKSPRLEEAPGIRIESQGPTWLWGTGGGDKPQLDEVAKAADLFASWVQDYASLTDVE